MSAAKAESVLGSRHLQHVPQMMETGLLIEYRRCQSPEKTTTAAYMNFFERTQLARREGELGVACLLQGWFVSVSLEGATGQAAALPPVLSFWPAEFCSLGQPVPKGGSVPPGTSSGGKQRTSRPYQTCCKLTSGAQDGLTFQIAPPDAVGERTTSVHNPQSNAQSSASVFCPQDVRRNCMIGTAALLISLPLAILLCCVVIRRRRKRKQRLSAASGAQRESGGGPSRPDSRTSHTSRPGTPESWTQRQQPPLRPAKPARPPSPRPPRPPSPAPAPQLLRNQPSAFQPQPQPKRPYRPPSPVVGPYGKG
ncbi:uncharacterized protein WM294_007941 [Sarcoramphus papa]